MKNKIVLKKTLLSILITSLIFIIALLLTNNYYYKKYTSNYNKKVASLVYVIKEKYPSISSKEIADILNSNDDYDLSKFGIDIDKESVILENDKLKEERIIVEIIVIVIFIMIIIYIIYIFNKKKNKNIYDITKMIEEISEGNYSIDFENKNEDELSILRDDLYKITLKLKEESNNSLKDKKSLKESIENISHQIKTPLTVIAISLDNLLDSNKITERKRKEFLLDIKKEINNINYLVKSLLDLSRFDVNVIEFKRKENSILDIINRSVDKIDLIRDLKDIKINVTGNDYKFLCDYDWEVEAISNILKNAIEHSNDNSIINIEIGNNKIYNYIKISNNGKTINEDELKNIFKRFYSSKDNVKDSTGIGLSLAKAIIEKDDGKIIAESKNGVTSFTINYYGKDK